MSEKSKILITGASSGIGAVYADRFAGAAMISCSSRATPLA